MSYARQMIITDKHVRYIVTIFRAPFPFLVYILTACGAPVAQLCIPVYLLFLRWLPAIDIYILPVRSNQVNGRRTSVTQSARNHIDIGGRCGDESVCRSPKLISY